MLKAKYDWQLVPQQDEQLVQTIQEQCQLPRALANLLVARGFKSLADVQLFLKPQLQQIQPPEKLHDLDKAVQRIRQAINVGEKITIYGDYDADGMTSTALLYETLETMGANVDYYVPDRFKDGYGPNQEAYQRIIDSGTKLIVTVDNGVTGKDEVAFAKDHDVDVVITDHHSLPEQLPDAVAIVHPQFPGAEYPYGDLSGVGVAFKAAWGLLEEFPTELLDLVAIGEIADLVSMAKENHALVKLGIQQLQQGLRPGLHALLKLTNVAEEELTGQDVAFQLAPRLNALGRIANGNDGVKLLTTVDADEAQRLAKQVDECNQERQQLVAQIAQEALAKAQTPDNLQRKTLLIVGHGWHQGVLGIVASKVVEQTGKPTIVASVNQGELVAKGSGRSIDGYDLFAALDGHRDLMKAFGGHVMACGMSFLITQVPAIAKVLEQAADDQQLDLHRQPQIEVTAQLTTSDLSLDLYSQVQRLAPFGPDNEEPLFEIDQPVIQKVQQMGKTNQHLKFTIGDAQPVDILVFNQGQLADQFSPGSQISFIGQLSVNSWRGNKKIQMMLKDQTAQGPVVMDARTHQLQAKMFADQAVYVVFNDRLRRNIEGHVKGIVVDGTHAENVGQDGHELIIVDTPARITDLVRVLEQLTGVQTVKLWLFDHQQLHQDPLPTRQQFVNLYRTIRQSKAINLSQQGSALSDYLKVTRNQLVLMIKVFLELRFVTMNNGLLKLAAQIQNGQLEATRVYQNYAARLQVEQVLLKSDTNTLNAWVRKHLASN
ncbi:single-stranded-DNA-specific exonuclease RecJ [Limosilactobacillus caecicola]|uniref:single-stranded-DNA-specific exonuclease RecJ n=1 Tax=Limosilactobacillus caecicola TaxID=2941332 RepID=UPI00203D4CC2|nr:single-stranded-DNA-specific exonuclease RecJ [Limosilactobacillus caecicola]